MTMCIPSTTDWSCYGDEEKIAALDPRIKRRAEVLAWTTLRSLLGNRLSLCPTEIRPCTMAARERTYYSAPVAGFTGSAFQPTLDNGVWTNGCGCRSGSACGCVGAEAVRMPGTVARVESVRIDGVEVPSSAYRVDDGNLLVRQDGEHWPINQDMSAPIDAEGTFVVSYWLGLAPDELTSIAAGLLAVEFYLACKGEKCKLPDGVRTVTRQGVTMEIRTDMFENGLTGIKGVDSVIRAYNPHALKQEASVMIPRPTRGGRRTTWSR